MLPIEAKQELLGRTLDLTTVQAESVQQQNDGTLKKGHSKNKSLKQVIRDRRVAVRHFGFTRNKTATGIAKDNSM